LICPICTGHPGTLPVLNEEVVNYGIKLALALNLKINKNLFLPENLIFILISQLVIKYLNLKNPYHLKGIIF